MMRRVLISFGAPGPGTLTMTLAKKATVLASGRHVYGAAGEGSLTLKLTKRARHARRVKATLKASFTPQGGAATTVSRSVT